MLARNELPKISIDSLNSDFDREGKNLIFSGQVVAIAAGTLISANRITLDREASQLKAYGQVMIMSNNQVLMGDSLVFGLENKSFTLTNALIMTNNPEATNAVKNQLLGFSDNELKFEAARKVELQRINKQKTELQEHYRHQISERKTPDPRITEQYILLLEREQQMNSGINQSLAAQPGAIRENIQRRRRQWTESQELAPDPKKHFESVGYFSLEGGVIRKISEDQFEAKGLFITPCICSRNESPPWGFRAASVKARSEGYAALEHPILEIKGLPVLYLPFLQIPVKSQRQSGFLLPGISHSRNNGSMFSQPVYFAFNDHSDATMVTDLIEKRGLRLGVEYRVQSREYSGWELNFEGIRDKAWLGQAATRERLAKRYADGLDAAAAAHARGTKPARPPGEPIDIGDPEWWLSSGLGYCLSANNVEKCKAHEIRNHLRLPSNSWRGQFSWKGLTVIAPRLSLVSHGILSSDHRYSQDLWVPGLTESLSAKAPVRISAPSRCRLHLDGSDFYAALSSDFSDPYRARERFSGYQTPLSLRFQTRLFPLTGTVAILPVYFQGSAEQKRIEIFKDASFSKTLPENTLFQRLGNGNWRRVSGKFTSPLVSKQVFNADYFADIEYRGVESSEPHQRGHRLDEAAKASRPNFSASASSLTTMRSGFHFGLPLEGTWTLPSFLVEEPAEDRFSAIQKEKKIRHTMNWDITLAMRPWVARRGAYGETSEYLKYVDSNWIPAGNSDGLTYYPSDRRLQPGQEILFSTTHDWYAFDEVWKLLPGSAKSSSAEGLSDKPEEKTEETLAERAERELWFSLDKAVSGTADMFASDGTWYSNRYQLVTERQINPVHLESKISYDYRKQKQRNKLRQETRNAVATSRLPEPWSPLETTIIFKMINCSLFTANSWNLYSHNFTNMVFNLKLPTIFGLSPGFSYHIENREFLNNSGDIEASLIKTLSGSLSIKLIPHVSLSYSYGIRMQPDDRLQRRSTLLSGYNSPTRCWGLLFRWDKSFEDSEWKHGSYYLALVVNFLNQGRKFGNLASRYNDKAS